MDLRVIVALAVVVVLGIAAFGWFRLWLPHQKREREKLQRENHFHFFRYRWLPTEEAPRGLDVQQEVLADLQAREQMWDGFVFALKEMRFKSSVGVDLQTDDLALLIGTHAAVKAELDRAKGLHHLQQQSAKTEVSKPPDTKSGNGA